MTAKAYALICRVMLQATVVALVYAFAIAMTRLWPLMLAVVIAAAIYHHRRGVLSGNSGAFGTARWANMLDLLRGGLFSGRGLLFGRFNGFPLPRLQAVMLLFTLPASESVLAVRMFIASFTRPTA